MIFNRASGPLLTAYILMGAAGALFLVTPPIILTDAIEYSQLSMLWGVFYLVGGTVSSVSLVSRVIVKKSISLWYFETAGLALLVTANFVYAYALARTGFYYEQYSIVAVSLILASFSSGLIARSIETLRLIRIIRNVTASSGA